MRKQIVILAAVLLAGLAAAACGSSGESSGESTGTTAAGGQMGDMTGDDGHMGHGGSSDVAADAREIRVTAADLAFDPVEIKAEPGEDLAIVLTSEDITHDFTIDELDAHVAADRGETAKGGVRDLEPGEYTFYCSVAGHRAAGMEGTLIVE